MFARFAHFYGMTDEQVLRMPARRFWSMERQIDRILAGRELRQLQVHQGAYSQENSRRLIDKLVLDLGETCKLERTSVHAPDPDRSAKFARVMGY